jgi:quercetin dioxygenase-like cupin family protein
VSANGYFATASDREAPLAAPSVLDLGDVTALDLAPGLAAQPVVGNACMLTYVTWDERGAAPAHAHAEEQIVLVLEGEIELDFDGETRVLRPGQIGVIPPWVRHGARARARRCVTVEVFAPPRAALLAMLEAGEVR